MHQDANLLKVGVSRDQIAGAFGTPNETSNKGGHLQDLYEFNADGSKFVKPKIYAPNIAAGVFTGVLPPSCTRAGFTMPSSTSLCIISPTGWTALCSRFRKSRDKLQGDGADAPGYATGRTAKLVRSRCLSGRQPSSTRSICRRTRSSRTKKPH